MPPTTTCVRAAISNRRRTTGPSPALPIERWGGRGAFGKETMHSVTKTKADCGLSLRARHRSPALGLSASYGPPTNVAAAKAFGPTDAVDRDIGARLRL